MPQRSAAWIIFSLAFIAALGPFAVDAYLPAMPAMALDLPASVSAVQLTMSVYLIGVAVFPMILAPISDTFGRKPVMMAGLFAFAAVSAACAMAPGVEWLLALRLLQAAAGGAVMTVARAMLADLYRGDALSRAISHLMLVFTFAPVFAPVLGGQLLEFWGWRSIFWGLALLGVLMAGALATLPETLAADLRRPYRPGRIFRTYVAIFRQSDSRAYLIVTFWSALMFFAMLSSSPFIFVDHFGVSAVEFSWLFAGISMVAFASNAVNARLVMRRGYARMLRDATLFLLGLAAVMAVVAVTGFGGLWGVFAVMVCLMAAFHIVNANVTAGLMETVGREAGAASATMALWRFAGGAMGAAAVGAFGTTHPWTFALVFGVSALGMTTSFFRGVSRARAAGG